VSSKRRIRRKSLPRKKSLSDSLRAQDENVHAYQCPHCRQFHCGHLPAREWPQRKRANSRVQKLSVSVNAFWRSLFQSECALDVRWIFAIVQSRCRVKLLITRTLHSSADKNRPRQTIAA